MLATAQAAAVCVAESLAVCAGEVHTLLQCLPRTLHAE